MSFGSFVKNFKIKDKATAIKQYEDLLRSERIKARRRERLKASFAEFVGTRLDSFRSMWEQKAELTLRKLLSWLRTPHSLI